MPLRFLTLAAVLLLGAASYAAAQPYSNTRGLYLNVHASATSITYEADDFEDFDETDGGGGLGVEVGYGFSPLVSLFVALNGSGMEADGGDTYTLGHGDLGVRFNFRSGERLVPYASLAVTGRQATFEFENGGEIELSGGGGTLGGGLAYFVSPRLALDAGLRLTAGTFTDVSVGRLTVSNFDVDAGSGRLVFGLSWFPTR